MWYTLCEMKFFTHLYIRQFSLIYRLIGVTIGVVFLSISFFLISSGIMNMAHGSMAHCPYMNDGQGMCPMTVADHVQSWTQMFSVVIPQVIYGAVSGILFGFVVKMFFPLDTASWRFRLFWNAFQDPDTPIFQYLKRFFSQGIFHPKVYPVSA